jgi:hypothetical protein
LARRMINRNTPAPIKNSRHKYFTALLIMVN